MYICLTISRNFLFAGRQGLVGNTGPNGRLGNTGRLGSTGSTGATGTRGSPGIGVAGEYIHIQYKKTNLK